MPKSALSELRSLSQQWSAVLGSSVGLRTINERINQIEPLLRQARSELIVDVPAVVQFDGIWLRVQTQAETVKLDKRQRRRKKRKGKKMVLLVALGLWTDGSGKREVLDWQVADGESKAAWEPFVHRLWERGLRPETGLQAVIRDGCGELGEAIAWVYGTTVLEQRCIFHKLRNVADKCREELKGEAKKETRKQLIEQASAIYQAESPEEAKRRLAAFAEQWRARTPKAVATLERDFEQTIAYYALEGVALKWLSISRSNGSMLIGRRNLGGKPLARSISTFSISTLSNGYATNYCKLLSTLLYNVIM